MRINILVGGRAGFDGINFISKFISRSFAEKGFYVFNYRNYSSLIKGGHNFNVICVGNEPVNSFDRKFDIVLDMDGKTLLLHKNEIKRKAIIISLNKKVEKKYRYITINKKIEPLNILFASCLFKLFKFSKKEVMNYVKKFIKKDFEKNISVVRECYDEVEINEEISLRSDGKNKEVADGSEAVGMATIDSNVDIYLGYPMTPATSLLTYLAQHQNKKNIFVFTPENEIACINAALGASFAGARVMVGTSGGGFDLMSEGISMQGMTELPLVIYLAMRAGPSTGVPTYTTQADLNVALHAGHGEFARVVFTPGDANEAYELTRKAFEISEKYGILSIILVDKHLAESQYIFNVKKKKLKERKSFLGKYVYKVSSYEHTKEGYDSEEINDIVSGNERRIGKIEKIRKEIEKISYEIYGNKNSKNIIISFGSNKGAILDSLKELKNFKFIHVKIVEPFSNRLIKEIKNAKKLFVVEANRMSQFSDLITRNVGRLIKEDEKILKYDARPFTPSFIINELRRKNEKRKL